MKYSTYKYYKHQMKFYKSEKGDKNVESRKQFK